MSSAESVNRTCGWERLNWDQTVFCMGRSGSWWPSQWASCWVLPSKWVSCDRPLPALCLPAPSNSSPTLSAAKEVSFSSLYNTWSYVLWCGLTLVCCSLAAVLVISLSSCMIPSPSQKRLHAASLVHYKKKTEAKSHNLKEAYGTAAKENCVHRHCG